MVAPMHETDVDMTVGTGEGIVVDSIKVTHWSREKRAYQGGRSLAARPTTSRLYTRKPQYLQHKDTAKVQ